MGSLRRWVGSRVCEVGGLNCLRLLLALLLLVAAFLKLHQLYNRPIVGIEVYASRYITVAVVELEILLAVWLVTGLWAKWAWRMALCVFGGFSLVSFYKILSREPSCGCFGQVHVSPWVMLGCDLLAVAALGYWRPRQRTNSTRIPAAQLGISLVAGLALLAVPVVWLSQSAVSSDYSGSQVVDLTRKQGGRCAVVECTDIGRRLSQGEWSVLIYNSDCFQCRDSLQLLCAQEWCADNRRRAVLVRTSDKLPEVPAWIHVGMIAEDVRVVCKSPCQFTLKDGELLGS